VTSSFSLAVVLYASGLGGAFGLAALAGRRRGPGLGAGLIFLQGIAMIQGAIDALELIGVDRGAEAATNVGYLVLCVLALPLTAGAIQLDAGRWGNVGFAVGCVLLAVVSWRMHATLGAARA
jgi:hypothetical protein